MNKLSYDYTTTLTYPIEIYNPKNKRLQLEQVSATLTVQQKMNGFAIVRNKIYKTPTLHIPVSEEKYGKATPQANLYYVLSKNITDLVSEQLGTEHKVINISPDTIFFQVQTRAQKKVPVRYRLSYTTDKEYMQKGDPTIRPDSITIIGNSVILDTITQVYTSPKNLRTLNESAEGYLELETIKDIYFEESKVRYSIEVVRFTEGIFKSGVQVLNKPPSANITLIPSEVELRYRIPVSRFSAVDSSQFMLTIDYNDLVKSTDRTTKVNVTQQPADVLSVTLFPPFVEFIIRKQDQEND